MGATSSRFRRADVAGRNLRPGVLGGRGPGPDGDRSARSRPAHCSVTAWGQETVRGATGRRGRHRSCTRKRAPSRWPAWPAACGARGPDPRRRLPGRDGRERGARRATQRDYEGRHATSPWVRSCCANDWAAPSLQGYDGDRFRSTRGPIRSSNARMGIAVALLGKTDRMLPTWVRVLGLEERAAQVSDDDLDVVCADPERALEVLREVMRGVPDVRLRRGARPEARRWVPCSARCGSWARASGRSLVTSSPRCSPAFRSRGHRGVRARQASGPRAPPPRATPTPSLYRHRLATTRRRWR